MGLARETIRLRGTVIAVKFFVIAIYFFSHFNLSHADQSKEKNLSTTRGSQCSADNRTIITLRELRKNKKINHTSDQQSKSHVYKPRVAPKYTSETFLVSPKKIPLSSATLNTLESTGQSPSTSINFLALPDDNTAIPPDTMGAAGPNHLMTTLNSQIHIQDKKGINLLTESLFEFWIDVNPNNPPDPFDPRIVYDPFEQRWITVAVTDRDSSSAALLIGVSVTDDPTGEWFLYSIDVDASNQSWGDHPNLGFNKDWIIVSLNMFENSPGIDFFGSNIYVFDKADIYAGGDGLFTLLHDDNGVDMVPTQVYNNTLGTVFLVEDWSGTGAELRMSKIDGPVGSETLTVDTSRPTGPFPWNFGDLDNFATQLGSTKKIDAGDSRIQYCVYRNNSIWCVQTVFLPAISPTRSSIQWWKIDPLGDILQFGRIDDPSGVNYYAFPSIAVNKRDDVLIGYSHFSSNQYASASYSFRFGSDPINTLRNPSLLKSGEAPYFKDFGRGRNRWGDYSATVVDPTNDLSMWTIQEYATIPCESGFDRWSTWWGKINPTADLSVNSVFISDFLSGNGNESIDPGETIQLTTLLHNAGAETATNVFATLTAGSDSISITESNSSYPDISTGNVVSNSTSFTLKVPKSIGCGESLTFTNVISANGILYTNAFTQRIGQSLEQPFVTNFVDSADVPINITDHITAISTVDVASAPEQVIRDVNVSLRLDHTFNQDLLISIEHPDGTTVILSDSRGGSDQNFGSGACGSEESRTTFHDSADIPIIIGCAPFEGSFKPEQSLNTFNGKSANGTWKLRVTDDTQGDVGELLCWGLEIITSETPVNICSTFNNVPIASNQVVNVSGDTVNNLVLIGSDPDDDPISFILKELPTNGILTGLDQVTGNINYIPAHGFHGLDQFSFVVNDGTNDSNCAEIDLTVTPQTDTDEDGIPNYWELLYFNSETGAIASEDSDGDGKQTLSEYKSNTDPTDPRSLLKITNITQDEFGNVILNWASIGGTRYRIEFSDGDTNSNFANTFTEITLPATLEIDPAPIGQPSSMSFIDNFTLTPPIPKIGTRYYKIKIIEQN